MHSFFHISLLQKKLGQIDQSSCVVLAMEAPLKHSLHSGLRLWEFPDQYVIEPTDGSAAPCLDISRLDGSMKLIGLAFASFSLQ